MIVLKSRSERRRNKGLMQHIGRILHTLHNSGMAKFGVAPFSFFFFALPHMES